MITQATTANLDPGHSREVLDAAYRQVFGNMHLMELDVLPSVDALFMNGDLTVQGLITAWHSLKYRKYLEKNSPYGFVELNQILIGRSPKINRSHGAFRRWRMSFNAEIASYTYSDEYPRPSALIRFHFLE